MFRLTATRRHDHDYGQPFWFSDYRFSSPEDAMRSPDLFGRRGLAVRLENMRRAALGSVVALMLAAPWPAVADWPQLCRVGTADAFDFHFTFSEGGDDGPNGRHRGR